MKNIFSLLSNEVLKYRQKEKEPSFVQPMLATLTTNYFSSKDWLYEHKFDGERCIAIKKNGKVSLISRNKKDMNNEYPEILNALLKQEADNFIIDGEIIAGSKKGESDFQLLQGRISLKNTEKIKTKEKKFYVSYQIFDLMYVDGYSVCEIPLYARKVLLEKLLDYDKQLVYSTHKVGNGIEFFKKACQLKWEGLIAKRSDSKYVGIRSPNWLKFKCIMKQELVIGGLYESKKISPIFWCAISRIL